MLILAVNVPGKVTGMDFELDEEHRMLKDLVKRFVDDELISQETEMLAREASGPSELVVYPEGNHVCFNISYKFRPLSGDWMAKTLGGA